MNESRYSRACSRYHTRPSIASTGFPYMLICAKRALAFVMNSNRSDQDRERRTTPEPSRAARIPSPTHRDKHALEGVNKRNFIVILRLKFWRQLSIASSESLEVSVFLDGLWMELNLIYSHPKLKRSRSASCRLLLSKKD